MGYQKLSEYQIGLPLFKVSEPWKFQMFSFSIRWNKKRSLQQVISLSFKTE